MTVISCHSEPPSNCHSESPVVIVRGPLPIYVILRCPPLFCHSEEHTTKNLKSLCTHRFVAKWTVAEADLRFLTAFGMTGRGFGMTGRASG